MAENEPVPAGRLTIAYELSCGPGQDPRSMAEDLALEQTVELPVGCVPDAIAGAVVGRVEEVVDVGGGRARAVVSYDPALVGNVAGQLLNLLFGNVSLKVGVRVAGIEWPEALLAEFPGPRFGIEGLRELAGVAGRPLLCVAVKPVGLAAAELAERCRRFAIAGVDLVKDDHSLAGQEWAPFAERVARCHEAVEEANRESAGHTLYLPHLFGGPNGLARRARRLRALGIRGALVSPMLLGWDAVRWLAETSGVAILGHPSLTGSLFAPDHGIAPEALLGQVFRVLGCDGVIYPNAGGRFPFPLAACEAINRELRKPLGTLRPAFPVPGGGIDAARIPEWVGRYGPDTIFLVGSNLYSRPDPYAAAKGVVEVLRGWS